MKFTIIGSSGTVPRSDSGCSSYLFEADGFRLLVDMGNGSTGQLLEHCDLQEIDAILLTHMHGDHWLDLVLHAYVRRYDKVATSKPFPIYAPLGAENLLASALNWSRNEFSLAAYEFRDLSTGSISIGPFKIDLTRVAHPVETYAVRITHNDRSVTYSADSGECQALVDLASATDIFLCEAALDEHEVLPGVHLTATQAGNHARRAGADRLIITHLRPWANSELVLELASKEFGGTAELARSGNVYEL